MADNTKIEWADATLNYVNGCTRVSPGCVNCYAERLAATRLRNVPSRAGLAEMTPGGPRWTGKINIDDRMLDQALRWRRPRRIFWNAHGDLFHESVPDAAIDRLFAVCALTPHHTHMILTKRAGRMREYLSNDLLPIMVAMQVEGITDKECSGQSVEDRLPLPNVWLGVSVEDQPRADERIPDLLNTPAAIRFISAEPLLGPVDLTRICIVRRVTKSPRAGIHIDALTGRYVESGMPYIGDWDVSKPYPTDAQPLTLDWVIAGGESGPGARPMHPAWARSLRDQCAAAGVPFLFKQWGEWLPYGCVDASGFQNSTTRGEKPGQWHEWGGGQGFSVRISKKAAGRLLDGIEHNAFPEVRHG